MSISEDNVGKKQLKQRIADLEQRVADLEAELARRRRNEAHFEWKVSGGTMEQYYLISQSDVDLLQSMTYGNARYVLDTGLHITDAVPTDALTEEAVQTKSEANLLQLDQSSLSE